MASAALAGFRSAIIGQIMFLGIYSVFGSERINWRRGFVMGLCVMLFIFIAAFFADHMPLSMQRALSFVPFSNVSWEAKADAMGTTIWRIEVWKRAVNDIPRYLWLGQGFAFNPRELMDIIAAGAYIRDWAFVVRAYHNGLLSLLLIFGLPGFIAGIGFLVSAGLEYNRIRRGEWQDDNLKRIFNVMFAQFIAQIIGFLLIYGDTQVSFPVFLFQAMVLEGIAKTKEVLQYEGQIEAGAKMIRKENE
ncbi:MAG: O-antigen ligase family protein [Kiritimatiellae bacterium]|nr:O-antigen ligase family protein [Kiritimatiellia bacterium]MDD5523062.1 O-antigen ligase family protein [Kiritimatiellia bacterium]